MGYFKKIKILDPACGSGAFLIKAVDILLNIQKEIQLFKQNEGEYIAIKVGRKVRKNKTQFNLLKWKEEDEARDIISNNIFGVDINEESVEITKLSLFLKTARKNKKLPVLDTNIKCGNSLIDDKEVDSKAFKWEDEFKEIIDKGGFDVIIGNPPWGAKIEETQLSYIKSKNKEIIVRIIDSFMFFINLSLKLTSNKGNIGVIVPDVILYQKDNEKLRKVILNQKHIQNIINLGDFVFEGVSRPSCIIVLSGTQQNYIKVANTSKTKEKEKKLSDFIKVSKNIYNSLPSNIFPTTNLGGYIILKRLHLSPKLYQFIDEDDIQRGVSPDYKDAFIVTPEIIEKHKLEKSKLKKTITGGKDVKRYYINQNEKYVIYLTREDNYRLFPNICRYINKFKDKIICKEVKQGKHPLFALHRPRESKIFEKQEKIVGVITGDKIITTIDNLRFYPTDGLYLFSTTQEINQKFMISILNSKLFTFLYRLISLETGRTLAQIKPSTLKDLPFIKISLEQQKPFIKKAELMLKLNKEFYDKKLKFVNRIQQNLKLQKITKKLDNFFDLDFKQFCEELKKQKIEFSLKEQDEWEDYFNQYKKELLKLKENIETTDKEIDEMVYKLYGITDKERKIIEKV